MSTQTPVNKTIVQAPVIAGYLYGLNDVQKNMYREVFCLQEDVDIVKHFMFNILPKLNATNENACPTIHAIINSIRGESCNTEVSKEVKKMIIDFKKQVTSKIATHGGYRSVNYRDCILDITNKTLYLLGRKPVKYMLHNISFRDLQQNIIYNAKISVDKHVLVLEDGTRIILGKGQLAKHINGGQNWGQGQTQQILYPTILESTQQQQGYQNVGPTGISDAINGLQRSAFTNEYIGNQLDTGNTVDYGNTVDFSALGGVEMSCC